MSTQELQDWFRDKLAEEASMDRTAVDLDSDFSNFNLDSLTVVSIAYDLETLTGVIIDPGSFSEFKTPNEMVKWLQLQVK